MLVSLSLTAVNDERLSVSIVLSAVRGVNGLIPSSSATVDVVAALLVVSVVIPVVVDTVVGVVVAAVLVVSVVAPAVVDFVVSVVAAAVAVSVAVAENSFQLDHKGSVDVRATDSAEFTNASVLVSSGDRTRLPPL